MQVTGRPRPGVFFLMMRRPARSTLFPYMTLFRSVGNGHFGRRYEEEAVGRRLVGVRLELGDLAGALHDRAGHDERRLHFAVAVLAGAEVEHEADSRARQPRALAHAQRESRTRQLPAPPELQEPARGCHLPL